MRFLRWLTGRSVPDLGDINDAVQHRKPVRINGRLYAPVNFEELGADMHSEVRLTFIPGGLAPLLVADQEHTR